MTLDAEDQSRKATVDVRVDVTRGACTVPAVRHATLRLAAALVVAASLAGADRSDAQTAGRVFADSFESGNTNQWSADGSRNKCTAVRTAVDGRATRSGSYMLECNWNGVVAWNDPAFYSTVRLNSWNYSREFLIRFWVRHALDVDRVAGNKLLRLYPSNGLDSFYLAAQMETSGQPMFSYWELINGQPGPKFWGDSTPLGDGTWHKIEIYVRHNTPGNADGAVKVWLDGLLKQQANNIVTSSAGARWYPLYIMSNWSNNPGWEHDGNNHVYWDDIEIYSDLGTGGTGSMADASIRQSTSGDTTAPAAPVNVRIVK